MEGGGRCKLMMPIVNTNSEWCKTCSWEEARKLKVSLKSKTVVPTPNVSSGWLIRGQGIGHRRILIFADNSDFKHPYYYSRSRGKSCLGCQEQLYPWRIPLERCLYRIVGAAPSALFIYQPKCLICPTHPWLVKTIFDYIPLFHWYNLFPHPESVASGSLGSRSPMGFLKITSHITG